VVPVVLCRDDCYSFGFDVGYSSDISLEHFLIRQLDCRSHWLDSNLKLSVKKSPENLSQQSEIVDGVKGAESSMVRLFTVG